MGNYSQNQDQIQGQNQNKNQNQSKNQNEGQEQDQKQKQNQNQDQKQTQNKNQNQNQKGDSGILLGVYIHCEGCASEILKCLRGFEGVEDIVIDQKNHKVTVKGKNADPLKVQQRLQKKTQKHVELISPKIDKDAKEKAEAKAKAEAAKKAEEKKLQVVNVVLKVNMHCENCALEVKKCALKMQGVTYVETDKAKSQVTVRGAFEPTKLVTFLYRRAGKHVEIVKQEQANNKKKDAEVGGNNNNNNNKNNNANNNKKDKGEELFFYYPPQIVMEQAYPPQIFSDENVNACSVM